MVEDNLSPVLRYFISERDSIVVVVFAGSLTRDAQSALEKCGEEVAAKKPARVILMFRDVSNRVQVGGLTAFTRFKAAIRALPAELRICGLHPDFLKLLSARGILRPAEVFNNLHEALLDPRGKGK